MKRRSAALVSSTSTAAIVLSLACAVVLMESFSPRLCLAQTTEQATPPSAKRKKSKDRKAKVREAASVIRSTAASTGLPDLGLSQSEEAKKLREGLLKTINASHLSGDLGVWVGRSSAQGIETFFNFHADRGLIPASLSKLPTLATALHELHPDYKYKTLLLTDGKQQDGHLSGSLFLKGGGDPSFVSEDMWLLVNDLTHAGVTSIDGDIVVDDTRFDGVRYGEDRQKERVDRAYDAPIGAMSMNWNSVNIYVRPGEKAGDKLRVSVDVMSPYLTVRNETKTIASGHGQTISVERTTDKKNGIEEVVVRGSMAVGQNETVVYKSITAPDLFSGYNLAEFLKQRGIAFNGKIRTGSAPSSARVMATYEGKPLSQIVADMAKWSNNFVAEMLAKNLSAEGGEAPGTMTGGISRIRKYLEQIGLKSGEYEFVNAAGFTRENKLSPAQIGRLLETVHNDLTIYPEFLSALPIAGIDGTLRHRMNGTAAERWVRAKTGLLNGVAGLAGFVGRPNGSVLTFAFIYNGGHEDKAKATFDRLASALVED